MLCALQGPISIASRRTASLALNCSITATPELARCFATVPKPRNGKAITLGEVLARTKDAVKTKGTLRGAASASPAKVKDAGKKVAAKKDDKSGKKVAGKKDDKALKKEGKAAGKLIHSLQKRGAPAKDIAAIKKVAKGAASQPAKSTSASLEKQKEAKRKAELAEKEKERKKAQLLEDQRNKQKELARQQKEKAQLASKQARQAQEEKLAKQKEAAARARIAHKKMQEEQREKQRQRDQVLAERAKKQREQEKAKEEAQTKKDKERAAALKVQEKDQKAKQLVREKLEAAKKAKAEMPKRALTAWIFFLNDFRANNQSMPHKEILGAAAKQFASLTPEQKQKYEQQAEQDKARSQADKEAYALAHPKPPSRPISGYFRFLMSAREDIVKQNPGAKLTEISRIAGQRWAALPEQEKQTFEEQKKAEQAQYERDIAAFRQKYPQKAAK